MEVSLQIIDCQFESQLTHDADIQVLVVKTGSEAHFFGFLNDLLGILPFVIEPRHLALFESLVAVVVGVSKRWPILIDLLFVKLAHHTILVVHLKNTKIGKKLALLNTLKFSTSDRCIEVIVLHHATCVGVWRCLPAATTRLRLDWTIGNLDGKRDCKRTLSWKLICECSWQTFTSCRRVACSLITVTGGRHGELVVLLAFIGTWGASGHCCSIGPRPDTRLTLCRTSFNSCSLVFDHISLWWTDTI